jgi:hypothetical protein
MIRRPVSIADGSYPDEDTARVEGSRRSLADYGGVGSTMRGE